jgi:hypothetical protein
MSSTLLELEQVRCSVNDVTWLDYVTLRTTGNRVGLSGKTLGISALLTGDAILTSGELRVLGKPLEIARVEQLFGCAVPPKILPPKWTVRRVLELAAEVAGYSRRDSVARATTVAEQIGEPLILKSQWSRGNTLEQALATLALGLLTDSPVLFLHLPLGELQEQALSRYGAALARAVDGRGFIAELTRPALHHEEVAWVGSLDEITYVFDVGASGNAVPLGSNKVRYLLRVVGDTDQVAAALLRSGLSATAMRAPSDLLLGRTAFLVDVNCDAKAVADTGTLLDVCVELSLVVLELLPVATLSNSSGVV